MAKRVSMKKVARTYRKNTKPTKVEWDGARRFDGSTGKYSGVAKVTRGENTYKPKARKITVGGTKRGKGSTKTKTGRA